MIYAKPYLEKYKGRKTRHECPQCHDRFSFTYYLDGATGKVIDKLVGRCDHESGCGYHYTPKQYLEDNPQLLSSLRAERSNPYKEQIASSSLLAMTHRSEAAKTPQKASEIPKEYLVRSLGYNSNFVAFLCAIFDQAMLESPTVERIMADYYLGQTKDASVIFWQIGVDKRIRTGKIMQYDRHTGKRLKNASGAIDWVHARLKKEKVLPDDFELEQCCFGEHLLARYPDRSVALVESEKSAIIASGVYPDYVWLATGGRSQLSADKLRVLKGRTVILFPDADGYELWCEKAKELELLGCTVMVSDALEKNASAEDKAAKIDIADWLIRELRWQSKQPAAQTQTADEKALQALGNINPTIHSLINALDLVSVRTAEPIQIQNT